MMAPIQDSADIAHEPAGFGKTARRSWGEAIEADNWSLDRQHECGDWRERNRISGHQSQRYCNNNPPKGRIE